MLSYNQGLQEFKLLRLIINRLEMFGICGDIGLRRGNNINNSTKLSRILN